MSHQHKGHTDTGHRFKVSSERPEKRAGFEPATPVLHWAIYTTLRPLLSTVHLQWLEHLWNHENVFETGVVRGNECSS